MIAMKDVEKIRKTYQSTLLTFLVLDLISVVISCLYKDVVSIISTIIWSIFLFIGYHKAKKREESAWIIGVATACSMIPAIVLTRFILCIIFFVIILIDSLKYKNTFKE